MCRGGSRGLGGRRGGVSGALTGVLRRHCYCHRGSCWSVELNQDFVMSGLTILRFLDVSVFSGSFCHIE